LTKSILTKKTLAAQRNSWKKSVEDALMEAKAELKSIEQIVEQEPGTKQKFIMDQNNKISALEV
jgi:hypothetical protein